MSTSDHKNDDSFDEDLDALLTEQEPGFFRRYGLVLALCILGGGGIAWWLVSTASGPKPSAPKPQEFSMVRVALPPPPPPPPPQVKPEDTAPKPDEQQMIEQEPVAADEPKPAETPQPVAEESAAPMGTNIQGDGPSDGFGLVGRGGGSIIGGTGTGNKNASGTGSGSRWSWYAAQVQNTVAEALRKNEKTRAADLRVTVRIWPDDAGRIRAVRLVGSTGNRELDTAIEKDVLSGLTLREPPPADMPSPIVLRLTARRP
ncbi:hypothetical protein Ga0100231_012215 [Opitutaceae bacterium TAV4]|nr:hypothetical protein Ga0100231_012215 [Opitutaceae bacterium TAV4]RRK02106.1 hypothetical protein Ga0100230_002575 [Opitutaceae bacterium TAV3]